MRVLVCGEYGVFCKELIARLKKEKHDVFVIIGSEKPKRKRPKEGVFQDYEFSFRSKSIRTVMKNITPDVMIMLGAYDIKFSWQETNQESVRYLTGMTNLLMGAKEAGTSEVIYCSTLGILEDCTTSVPEEDEQEIRRNIYCQTMLQMNNICDEQNNLENFRVKKIHFAEIYGDYGVHPYSYCNEVMDAYWKQDSIQINSDKKHRVLYVNDAVDSVIKVMDSNDDVIDYYVEGSVYTESEITNAVKHVNRSREVQIEENGEKVYNLPEIPDSMVTIDSFKEKFSLQDGLSQLQKVIEKEKAHIVVEDEKRPILKDKIIPLVENIGLFLITFLISMLLRNTWIGEQVNFYLFYMVIIGIVYGISHSLFAIVLVFLAKTLELLNLGNAFDYAPYIDVLQVLIVGVSVGYMRDKYKRKNSDLEDEKKYYQSELVDMTKIYDSNLYVKSLYEKRLVNYENSMAKIYEITSRLDFWEPQKVMFQAVDVLKELMEMEDVAIYITDKAAKYLRLTASSTEKARSMGRSICIDDKFFMSSEVAEKTVYRNKDFASEKPTYACGVYTDNELTAIVMLWTDELNQINLYQTNMLTLTCRLIEAAMNRSRLYWNTLSEQYIEDTSIMQQEGIEKMIELCKQGESEGKMVYELLRVPESFLITHKPMVMEKVSSLIRETDYVGLKDDGLYVILMNASPEDTNYVIDRFEKATILVESVVE